MVGAARVRAVLRRESRKAFLKILDTYQRALQPQNPWEADLVDDLVSNLWRKWRIRSLETALLNDDIADHAQFCRRDKTDATTTVARAVRHSLIGSPVLDVLNRFETRYGRNATSALRLLFQLRAQSAGKENSKENRK